MSEFSITKLAASVMTGISDKDNEKKLEKQHARITPDSFYQNLLGARLNGSVSSSNTAATKVD